MALQGIKYLSNARLVVAQAADLDLPVGTRDDFAHWLVLNYYDADPENLSDEVSQFEEEWDMWAESPYSFEEELRKRYLCVCLARRDSAKAWRLVRQSVALALSEIGEPALASHLVCLARPIERPVVPATRSVVLGCLIRLLRAVESALTGRPKGVRAILSSYLERERHRAEAEVFNDLPRQLRLQGRTDEYLPGPSLLAALALASETHTALRVLLVEAQMSEYIGQPEMVSNVAASRGHRRLL